MHRVLWLAAVLVALLAVPPALAQRAQTIPQVLASDAQRRFTMLLAALDAAGLTDTLAEEGPFTLIAPTNEAFALALDDMGMTADELWAYHGDLLTRLLRYHILPGRYSARALAVGPTLATALEGETVTFALDAGVLTAEGVVIDAEAMHASNGSIHVAAQVLLPTRPAPSQDNRTHLRIAHLSADARSVDIYLNGRLSDLQSMAFGTISDWMEVEPGSYEVGVAVAGGDPVKNTIGTLDAGEWVTAAVIGTRANRAWQIVFLREDHSPIADSVARIEFFHSAQGYGALDMRTRQVPVIVNLAFPGFYGSNDGLDTRDVSAGTYTFQIVAAGTTTPVLLERTLILLEGYNYFITATGVVGSLSLVVADTPPGE